jgi:hypothetical protein
MVDLPPQGMQHQGGAFGQSHPAIEPEGFGLQEGIGDECRGPVVPKFRRREQDHRFQQHLEYLCSK